MTTEIVARVQTGTKIKLNTEWPVENVVEKSGRMYRVTFGLCDGIASRAVDYRTRREAFEAAGIPAE